MLRRVFGSTRDEVTGECRRLHSEELVSSVRLIKYFSGDQGQGGQGM